MRGTRLLAQGLWIVGLLASPVGAGEVVKQRIEVMNAEDLALVDNGRWVIASSMPGGSLPHGALYGVGVESGVAYRLESDRVAGKDPSGAACDGPEPHGKLSPHGIDLQTVDGRETLFVVNHGQRESVEIYEVAAGDILELSWVDCLVLPEGAVANAVAVTPDGRVFVTNMVDLAGDDSVEEDGEAARWMGNILVWSKETGWERVPNSRIHAPNGLLVTEDGRDLYVASWAGGEVIRLPVSGDGSRATLALPFLPDNLRWGSENTILATGLHGTPEDVVACVMAQGACDISIPTGIASIATNELSLDCVRAIPLQMGTSTIAVGEDLWVGPVRGDHVWVIEGGEAAWDHCRERQ